MVTLEEMATEYVGLEDGRIAFVGSGPVPAARRTIDAADRVVAPGFIDMHVHLREPGREDAETVETELMLSDLESLEKRVTNLDKRAKAGDKESANTLRLVNLAPETLKKMPAELSGGETFAESTAGLFDGFRVDRDGRDRPPARAPWAGRGVRAAA